MGGTVGRTAAGVATGGLSEFAQKNPFGTPLPFQNPVRTGIQGLLGLSPDSSNGSNYGGDFSISPEELQANKDAINNLADQQYSDTTNALTGDAPNSLKSLLTQQAQQSFAKTLPQTAEDYNGGHLLNSTGYQQEVARQQGQLSSGISNQLAQQAIPALAQKQQLNQSALSRQFSLQDFIRKANIAKSIGAQTAPQVGNGKGQTGTLLSGVGSLAPLAGTLIGGPGGKAAGTAANAAINGGGVSGNPALSLLNNSSGYGRYS